MPNRSLGPSKPEPATFLSGQAANQDPPPLPTGSPALLDALPDAVVLVDREGRIVLANRQTETLLGHTPQDLVGRPAEFLFPYHFRETYARALETFGADPRSRPVDSRLDLHARRKDGTFVPVEVSLNHLATDAGPLMLVVIRDVAERKLFERLQQEFVAVISHELRTPLTGIRAFAQLLQRKQVYDHQMIEIIIRQSGRLTRLVGDLLDLARLETGRLELWRDHVDLIAVVHAAAEEARVLSEEHTIRVDAPPVRLVGLWDADRLHQVLANLLSNAVKYSPGGGEVLLRVEDLGSAARISVVDQGTGIAPELQERLFDRFQRDQPQGTAQVRGFGLGLYVTKALVEAHGGRVRVESSPGQGSTFVVTLPRDQEEMRAARLSLLTPDELKVARLVGEGLTNAQIAAWLALDDDQVELYISRCLARIGLNARSNLADLHLTSPDLPPT